MKAHNKFAQCALVSERLFYPIHFNSSVFHLAYQQNERTPDTKELCPKTALTHSTHTHAHAHALICRLWSLFSAIFIRKRQHEKKIHIFSLFLQYVALRLFIHSFQLSDASPKEFESKQCNSSIRRHSLCYLLCVCVCFVVVIISVALSFHFIRFSCSANGLPIDVVFFSTLSLLAFFTIMLDSQGI